ncbi:MULTISPECIES: hypothetical protein [unclassified Duganella]|uniref:hypothetical protein n=1 Tax=unclassified Duganella TaxID=2636909 RepID=UPI0008820191|nr:MULTISPECIES: hypothetical protein [unclassified Duganella]SDF80370.1 hypothetical protein SAMN05216320_1011373 [Duganella sp. OV458]SDI48853.1 hypothetical protein SAMN05428973_10142 [Duganella sp. OV510]
MSTTTQHGPAPAQTGTPEATALRKLGDWREKDRAHLAQKADRDAQRAEYRARQDLRGAADKLSGSGQP